MPENRADIKKLRSRIMAKHVELVASECKHEHYVINNIEEKRLMQKVCRECGVVLEESWKYDECRVHFNYSFKQAVVYL